LPIPINISEEGKYINEMDNFLFDYAPLEMLMFRKITIALNEGQLSKENYNKLKFK